jgi:cytochrome c553
VFLSAALLSSFSARAEEDAAAMAPISDSERQALFPGRAMIDMGSEVAQKACADCHGMDGISREAGTPDLAGQRTIYLYRTLQAYQDHTRHSDSMGHTTGFLNDDALLAVSAYYANLPPNQPAKQEVATGAADSGDVFADIRDDMRKCVKCHGEDGNSDGSGMPNLTAQAPEYLESAMRAYVDGDRSHRLMGKLVSGLDPQTIKTMAIYYAVQKPKASSTEADGDAAKGQVLAEACSTCHGEDGNAGNAETPSLAGQDPRYFVKAMDQYKKGRRKYEKMYEAVEKLSDEDIDNLAAFYAAQAPVRRNVRTPLTTGEWIARCERCHGLDGNSTDPRFPMLAGQDETYLAKALKAYAGGTRSNSIMHAMADPLSASDLERIAKHYSMQSPKSVVYMQLPCEDNNPQ